MAIAIPYFPNEPWSEIFLLFDAEGEITDLTGTTLEMQFRPNAKSETVYAIATLTNSKLELVANQTGENLKGEEKTGMGLKVSLTAEETLAIFYGSKTAESDLKVTYPSNPEPEYLLELCLNPIIVNSRNYPLIPPSS